MSYATTAAKQQASNGLHEEPEEPEEAGSLTSLFPLDMLSAQVMISPAPNQPISNQPNQYAVVAEYENSEGRWGQADLQIVPAGTWHVLITHARANKSTIDTYTVTIYPNRKTWLYAKR